MAEKGIDIEIIRPGDTSVEITAGSGLVFDLTIPPSTNVENNYRCSEAVAWCQRSER